MIIFKNPEIAELIRKEEKMRPIAQNFFFYSAYLVTMIMLAGVTYFVWQQDLFVMMKVLILLPMVYISVLLTQCLNDNFNESGKAS